MQNPLDGISVYDIEEHREGKLLWKGIEVYQFSCAWGSRLPVKHRGNMRRLLRAGFRVYKPRKAEATYLVAMPDYVLSNPDAFTPVLLDKDQVIGM